jgi:23S rRNA (adenine2503-C2)-methyltransferase
MDFMRPLLETSSAELRDWLHARGQPPLRARQIRRWILQGRAESFDEMTDLPLELRQQLGQEFTPLGTRIVRHLEAGDGTHKLLLKLQDDQLIECVLIQEGDRRDRRAARAFAEPYRRRRPTHAHCRHGHG